jgi:tripartite-type tricarboxylate transporter receptor subunit TctC
MKNSVKIMLSALCLTSGIAQAEYPNKDIQGIIQWSAGGATDTVMRSVAPKAEEILGGDFILTNRPGGVGVIATKYVYAKPNDGYTILMGAENPQLYKVMGLTDIDYSDLVPINILAQAASIFVVRSDAPYNNIKEFVEYAQAHPNTLKVGDTGPGGLPSIMMALLNSQSKLEVMTIPYNGDGPAITALLGGAIDMEPATYSAAKEYIKSGQLKIIGLLDKSAHEELPGVDPITKYYPALASQLPYSPFFGVFVKKGTPQEAIDKLNHAFNVAADSAEFRNVLEARGLAPLNLSGDAAAEYLERFRSVASWLAFDNGMAKHSPEKFGIKRAQ